MVFVCVKTVLRESEVLRPQISNGSLAMQAILKKIKTKLGTKYVCFLPSARNGMQKFPITWSEICWFQYCSVEQDGCTKAV